MIKIEESDKPDEDWDKRVLEADGFLYQTARYAEYMKEALGMKLLFLTAKDRSTGRIVGQLAVHFGPLFCKYLKDKHENLFKIFSKFFKVYHFIKGPVIFDKSLKKEIYEEFIKYLDTLGKKAFMLQDISLPIYEDEEIYEIFKKYGFYSDSWGTVLVDTTKSEEELWQCLIKSRRNIVRRGINQGLVVKEAVSKEDYDKVIKIIEDMSNRNQVFAYPKEYYHIFFETLSKGNNIKTFFIEKDGQGIATVSVYLFGKRAIQALPAHTDYSIKQKISGTDFLEWYIIKWCHDNGYNTYDLSGIRPESTDQKEIGIREYKMRWGGQVITYPYFSKVYSRFKGEIANFMRKVYKGQKIKKNELSKPYEKDQLT